MYLTERKQKTQRYSFLDPQAFPMPIRRKNWTKSAPHSPIPVTQLRTVKSGGFHKERKLILVNHHSKSIGTGAVAYAHVRTRSKEIILLTKARLCFITFVRNKK